MGIINDTDRLQALESLQILDTLPEQEYDNITKLAAYICKTPIALVSLVSDTKQFFKSNHGLEDRETPLDVSFCKHVIADKDKPFIVTDARADDRFKHNALVVNAPNIRFYAGVPLVTEDGFAVGSLCVIDQQPRQLDEDQLTALTSLANQVNQLLTLRRSHIVLQENKKQIAGDAARLNNIIEGTRVGTWEWNIQTGQVLINHRWAEMIGYTFEEMGVQDNYLDIAFWYKIVHPDDLAFSEEKLRDCFEKRTAYFDLECRLLHKDGHVVWINDRGRMVSWTDDGRPLIMSGTHTDITERKAAELQIKAISDNLPGVVLKYRLFADDTDAFEFVSGGAQKFWGISAEDVMQDSHLVWRNCHPEDVPNTFLSIKKSAAELTEWVSELRYLHPNGNTYWHKGIGKPELQPDGSVVWSTIVLDVTAEKQVKLALEETEKKFIHLFDHVTSLSVQGYSSDGTVVFWNKASELVYGYTQDEAIGKKLWDLIIPAPIVEEVKNNVAEMIAKGEGMPAQELLLQRKDGKLISVFSNHSVIQIPGRTPELYCIDIDLSAQKEAEEQLRQSETLMAEAQKLAKMGSWNFDFRTDRLTWTDALYDVFGADRNTFKETHGSFINLIIPEDRELALRASKHTQETGEPFNIEYRIVTPCGHSKTIEEFGFAEKDEQGKVIRLFGTAQDITERKKAEVAIKESNQRYAYATQATSDVIWDWDVEAKKVNWGNNYAEIFGIIEMDGLNDTEIVSRRIHPNELEDLLIKSTKTIRSSETKWDLEHRYLKADGTYAYISNKALIIRNEEGRAIRVIGAMQDITQRKLEEQHRKLLESVITHTNDSVIITEAEPTDGLGHKIIYVNDAFTRMTGYTPEEVIGKTPKILQGPKSDKELLGKMGTALRAWESYEVTTVNYKKNGEEFWINFSASPVANEHGWFTHWISIQRDVTQRVLKEQQKLIIGELSRELNKGLSVRTTLEAVMNHLVKIEKFLLAEAWLVTPNKEKIELVANVPITESTQTFYEQAHVYSFKKGEGIAGIIWENKATRIWPHITDNDEVKRRIAFEALGVRSIIGIPLSHAGEVIGVLVFCSAQPAESLSIFLKILNELAPMLGGELQRKQTEMELRQSNKRFELVSKATNDAIWEWNLTNSTIYQGDGYKTLFGYEPGLMHASVELWKNRIHPQDLQHMMDYLSDVFANPEQDSFYNEYRYLKQDGSYAFVIDRGLIIRNEKHKPVRILGALQDVTIRKQQEESLKKLNEQLQKHAKELMISNEELEQFAFVASHDLQEPLRMVTSFLTQLEKRYHAVLDDKARQYIHFAVDGAKRMRQIILDLLDFSRVGKQAETLEPINLKEVLDEVCLLQRKLISEKGALIKYPNMPVIDSFRAPMIQIFQNLIGNALKYSREDVPPIVDIAVTKTMESWEFSIKDNGIGVEKEYFDKIFIIFQKLIVDNGATGTGMGLAIVKKIIEKMEGKIWLESTLGEGTTFYFTIPIKPH